MTAQSNADDRYGGAFRRFLLVRDDDTTGVSGEGVVAIGVEYPDGAVHMQWLNAGNDGIETENNGCAFKPAPDGIDATRDVHGHGGRTRIVFMDDGANWCNHAQS